MTNGLTPETTETILSSISNIAITFMLLRSVSKGNFASWKEPVGIFIREFMGKTNVAGALNGLSLLGFLFLCKLLSSELHGFIIYFLFGVFPTFALGSIYFVYISEKAQKAQKTTSD